MYPERLFRASQGLTGPPANPLAEWQAADGPLETPSDRGGPQRVEASLRDRYGVGSASERRLPTLHSGPEMQVDDGVERASACSRPTLTSVVQRQALR